MAPLLNELAELFDEFRTVDVGLRHDSALANGTRGNSGCRWETGDINRYTVPVQRVGDRDNDARYPAHQENTTFQGDPRLPPRRTLGSSRRLTLIQLAATLL